MTLGRCVDCNQYLDYGPHRDVPHPISDALKKITADEWERIIEDLSADG